jgi:hypothetical protein
MLLSDKLLLDVFESYLKVFKDEPDHDRYADYG